MFDSALPSEPAGPTSAPGAEAPVDLPASVRVDARLTLHVDVAGDVTRIADRHEAGAMRFRFPRAHGRPPEAVMVNVAGGLAGGDRVAIEIAAGEGARLSVSSAAAERIYRAAGRGTTIAATLRLADGARVIWLPQETILQDGARLDRRFAVDLHPGAALVLGEMLYFGRRASGEGFSHGALHERWRIRSGNRLMFADETRIAGDFARDLPRRAALHRHVALATLILAAPDAGEHLAAVREGLPRTAGLECGASDLGGLVLVRFAGEDAARLRVAFLEAARQLAAVTGLPFPRALMT